MFRFFVVFFLVRAEISRMLFVILEDTEVYILFKTRKSFIFPFHPENYLHSADKMYLKAGFENARKEVCNTFCHSYLINMIINCTLVD